MGFARRAVRKSVRRATPRPVRQAMHPARTVKYAGTPRPVRQVSRAAYTVRHPVGVAENKVIGAALNAGTGRRSTGRRSSNGSASGPVGFWLWLLGPRRRRRQPDLPAAVPARQPNWPHNVTPTRLTPPAPRQAAPQRRQAPQPWPVDRAFRTSPPTSAKPAMPPQASAPASAGEWELEVRRSFGLGDGLRSPSQPKDD
jgi:hypothetical protein